MIYCIPQLDLEQFLHHGSISEYLNDPEEECRRPLLHTQQQTCKTIILSQAVVCFLHFMIWGRQFGSAVAHIENEIIMSVATINMDRTWRSSVWRITKTMISSQIWDSLCTKTWTFHHYMQVKTEKKKKKCLWLSVSWLVRLSSCWWQRGHWGQPGSTSQLWQESSCWSKKGTMETGGNGEGQEDVWMYRLGGWQIYI